MLQSFSIDFLIRIKNAYRAGKKNMVAPASNFCIDIATLLKRFGYIGSFSVSDDAKRQITFDLIYQNNQPSQVVVSMKKPPLFHGEKLVNH